MKMKFFPLLLAALPAAMFATSASADETVVQLGGAHIKIDNTDTGLVGGVPPNAHLEVGSANTLMIGLERRIGENWGIQFAGGIPPTHETKGAGSIAYLGKISTVKQLAPTIFVNYHFMEGSELRPYIGMGINYTRFIDPKSEYDQEIHLTDSVGFAYQAGLNYEITPQIGAFVSVAKASVKTNLVAIGATVQTTTLDFRPMVFSGGLTYKF